MRAGITGLAAALCFMASTGIGFGEEMPPVDVTVGDEAPHFECTDDAGWNWTSCDKLPSNYLILIFYPGDFDRRSNQRLAGYRERLEDFCERNVDVVGVSGDEVETHRLYQDLFAYNFLLLADADGEVARKFAVPFRSGGKARVRDAAGRLYPPKCRRSTIVQRGVTCEPQTFVIGPDGAVIFKNTAVDPASDAQQSLDFIDSHKRRNRGLSQEAVDSGGSALHNEGSSSGLIK